MVFLIPQISLCQQRVKNVVVIFSYGPNLPAFEKILEGLNSSIRTDSDFPVNIMAEYLDLNRSDQSDYSRFIVNMYNEKLNEFALDLLVTVGPGAHDAVMKYGNSALKALPVINVDLDLPGRTSILALDSTIGKEIIMKFKPAMTLRHAFDFFPNYKNVFVISGISRLDAFFTSQVLQHKSAFEPRYTFHFISNLTLDSAISFVRTIPPQSIVIVPAFLQDAAHVNFSTPEVLELFSKNSPAPVFLGLTDGGFTGQGGGIGGYLFSYILLGKEMGRIAREMLNGKPMQQISVHENDFYQHIYDWNKLTRWQLTNSKAIPENSVFYNRHLSFFELYKWYVLGVLIFILIQTYLIVYLVRLNKRQKMLSKQMQETERMHRELIHTDRLSKMSILTASLSHELFQPLAAIRLTAKAGQQFIQADKLDAPKASELFEHILEDETRATKIIRSVKALMKTETSARESILLNTLITDTLAIIHTDVENNQINMNVVLEAKPVWVQGDRVQLQQVLMNFIRNATTAMQQNDPQNKLLEISLKATKDSAIVSVKDSGMGLAPTVKETLFKPFTTTKKEGLGIGLALCKSLIENHQGKIWADNVPEGGTIFAFSLPLIKHS